MNICLWKHDNVIYLSHAETFHLCVVVVFRSLRLILVSKNPTTLKMLLIAVTHTRTPSSASRVAKTYKHIDLTTNTVFVVSMWIRIYIHIVENESDDQATVVANAQCTHWWLRRRRRKINCTTKMTKNNTEVCFAFDSVEKLLSI